MYLLEMAVGVIVPLCLLIVPAVRSNISAILIADILVISGVVINRLNVAVFGCTAI